MIEPKLSNFIKEGRSRDLKRSDVITVTSVIKPYVIYVKVHAFMLHVLEAHLGFLSSEHKYRNGDETHANNVLSISERKPKLEP